MSKSPSSKPADATDQPAADSPVNIEDDEPGWLLWARGRAPSGPEETPEAIAGKQQPRVLASFSNGTPFLVERQIGNGEVLFVSSGVYLGWNNLTRTNAVVLLDRLLRGLLTHSLPVRNYSTQERVVLAIDAADRRADFTLEHPAGGTESLFVDAVGADRFAISLRHLTQRGHYRLVAERPDDGSSAGTSEAAARQDASRGRKPHGTRLWQLELAVNGPADESELKTIGESDLRERLAGAPVRWVGRGDTIGLEGGAVRGQEFWKWLMAGALACLLLELAILTRSHLATKTSAVKPVAATMPA